MAFKQLSKIDKKTKLAVHGWIRNKEKTLRLRHIPSMINAICIVYFHDDEIFEIIGDDIKLSTNKKLVKTECEGDNENSNCYGIMKI